MNLARLFPVLLLFSAMHSLAFADSQGCANLSFIKIVEGTGQLPYHYVQKGCDSFDIYQVLEDQKFFVYSIRFGNSWREELENSDYEVGLRRHRWKWSHDRQKIIQEYVFDMQVKSTGDEYFTTASIVYSLAEGGVAENGVRQIRVLKQDSTTEVKTTPVAALHARIDQ